MSMRRFTRLTNSFSKKLENLQAAVALHFAHYNLVRVHKTLRVTPVMAANVTDRLSNRTDQDDEQIKISGQAANLIPGRDNRICFVTGDADRLRYVRGI